MRRALPIALLVAALSAAVGVYVTSEKPDGLERVTADLGLGADRAPGTDAGAGGAPAAAAPPRSRSRRALLALLGALAVGGVALAAGRLLGRRRSRAPEG